MATRANFGELIEPGLRKVLDDAFKNYQPYYPKVFNVADSSKASETDINATGFGLLTKKNENDPITYEDPLQGFKTTYTHQTFAGGSQYSMELFDDDLYGVITKDFAKKARQAARSVDYTVFNTLRGGFNTARTSYGDAKPLFSTSHTRKDGGTAQSNASSTGVILTEANLETGLNALRTQLDDKGQLIEIGGGKVTLVVPRALAKEAVEITKSELRSGTADNDINFYQGAINVLVVPWIGAEVSASGADFDAGSNTAWFLKAEDYSELNCFWRKKPELDRETDFDTKAEKFSIVGRWSYGWSDWRGTWGSKGDTLAYSS